MWLSLLRDTRNGKSVHQHIFSVSWMGESGPLKSSATYQLCALTKSLSCFLLCQEVTHPTWFVLLKIHPCIPEEPIFVGFNTASNFQKVRLFSHSFQRVRELPITILQFSIQIHHKQIRMEMLYVPPLPLLPVSYTGRTTIEFLVCSKMWTRIQCCVTLFMVFSHCF